MRAYDCGVTPEIQERNPFVPIVALVAVLAVAAGLAARFGLNSVVTVVCVATAIVGTWFLLSPQVEILESTTSGGAEAAGLAAPGRSGRAAFADVRESGSRERLRATPRVAVGFDRPGAGTRQNPTAPAHLPEIADDRVLDSVVPVRALGRLPQDAGALAVSDTVDPEGSISGAFTLGKFEIRAASRRGSDHAILNEVRQDDYVVASAAAGRYLIIVVADGHGPAENAHYGSHWASRLLAQAIDRHLRDGVPGIEKMLDRTREEVGRLFDGTFEPDTKMHTIATTLVGLIAPVDGGPAAGFRVGGGDILEPSATGWTSVFTEPTAPEGATFPSSIQAQVVPLEFDAPCLLLAADGVSAPLAANDELAQAFADELDAPVTEVEFDQLLSFPLEEARGDRTAVGVWFAAG